jgi:hypothetical protein
MVVMMINGTCDDDDADADADAAADDDVQQQVILETAIMTTLRMHKSVFSSSIITVHGERL